MSSNTVQVITGTARRSHM